VKVDSDYAHIAISDFWDTVKERGLMKGMDEYELQEINDAIVEDMRDTGFLPGKHKLKLIIKKGGIHYRIVYTGKKKRKKSSSVNTAVNTSKKVTSNKPPVHTNVNTNRRLISFRLAPTTLKKLDKWSKKLNISKTDIVEKGINLFLNKKKGK
jgi:hypothetical protein